MTKLYCIFSNKLAIMIHAIHMHIIILHNVLLLYVDCTEVSPSCYRHLYCHSS
jgi:hypothetical protein